MKSFTDLEQSKVLSEILPLESADAFYIIGKEPVDIVVIYGFVTHKHLKEQIAYKRAVPCWSLAALLDIYPMVAGRDMDMYCCWQNHKNLHSKHYNNPIDACYELILKLHELKML